MTGSDDADSGHREGPFRVLPGRTDDEWLLLDVASADPVSVPRASLPDVSVGNRVDGSVEWTGEAPTLPEPTVESTTRFRFRRTEEPIFEAAEGCFETARASGDPMNARVTYDTDRNPNGVVYTFAAQQSRDLFAEFRDGAKPLEPLVDRAAESAEPPFSVWVLDPREPFVVVYIVLEPDGLLDRTMADAYDR
jgi:hypothetical protein